MVIKLFHRHSLLVCIGLLAGVVALCMAVNFFGNQEDVPAQAPILPSSSFSDGQADSSVPEIPVEPASEDEMRAVWVPYMSLDMSQESDRSEAAFQQKFDTIVEEAKQCGMNALVVHVRPFGDALYPSNYFPWSHIVGGTQGTDPGYDRWNIWWRPRTRPGWSSTHGSIPCASSPAAILLLLWRRTTIIPSGTRMPAGMAGPSRPRPGSIITLPTAASGNSSRWRERNSGKLCGGRHPV